ncbi:hypothetical protein [Vitiosangium sp. GDMCC 1.1324]|uniref:hypothetical protein n=1 Tax=Vitiosangium sp. (strain GDMCC 1.1324) TaxID=2138576 RepID=UPI000D3AFE56|nr:hypothetical protein [Vitiosangium sp. GDMCC 1.1324]PTL74963.1 hypothetical protein DAT35_57390 [Vitiosangium sp. GDMCC 1.1324]
MPPRTWPACRFITAIRRFGHVWVVLAVLVPVPFSRRVWALPILFRLFRPQADCVPQAGAEEASVVPEAVARQEARKERPARVDQAGLRRRTFAVDVFACVMCGGRRRVLAYVN